MKKIYKKNLISGHACGETHCTTNIRQKEPITNKKVKALSGDASVKFLETIRKLKLFFILKSVLYLSCTNSKTGVLCDKGGNFMTA